MKLVLLLVVLLGLACTEKVDLNVENYRQNVQAKPQVWLVEYFSGMCGSCKEFDPTFTKLAKHFEKEVSIGRVNIDKPEGMKLAQEQDALNDGIPSLQIVHAANGKAETLMAGDLKSFNVLKRDIEKKLKELTKGAEGLYNKKADL